ncbi:CCA1 [Hepatospora eriocheir]|uniref:CCA1 n=1 Tax=Hepatospora eriocheir TaxID=1081669 RepID=A0A1X0QGY9_9MICR|nr:CCA1 [Hepatospora eriocheir]
MIIVLTKQERELFDLISKVAKTIVIDGETVTPRVAGGWVRDKILKINSSDIDITLDKISGYEFATKLVNEFKDKKKHLPKVKIIQANPEKSKHLETAIVRIYDICVDFANLRSEQYNNSRIPIISNGTPIEDAERRDLTINSLFYNIITNEIEDFTGRGKIDLKKGILDTPVDPLITFNDDPLRILRIIRFYAKFKYTITDRIVEAIKIPSIRDAFAKKISCERVYQELNKMLSYENGLLGIEKIIELEFYEPILKIDCSKFDFDFLKAQCFDMITEIDLKTDKRLLGFSLLVYPLIVTKIVDENSNPDSVLKNALKCDKSLFKSIKIIRENILFLYEKLKNKQKLDYSDIIDIILTCKEHIKESMLFSYIKTKDVRISNIIELIKHENLLEILKIKPLLNGKDFKKRVEKDKIGEYLKKSIRIQILYEITDKKELLSKVLHDHQENCVL